MEKSFFLLKILGLVSLLLTTVIWGSSFVFIKLSMSEISAPVYTFTRMTIAALTLLPFMLVKRFKNMSIATRDIKNGFVMGLAYGLGLTLQAAGTTYIDPSMSAFITGISTIHVHVYMATILRRYHIVDFLALVIAMSGLYIFTKPVGGLGIGGLLVLASTSMWALQIILIARHRASNIVDYLFGSFSAGVAFAPLAVFTWTPFTSDAIMYIIYLAIVCSIGATFFQVLGQRYVAPSTAALIFLLEPVFATIFSVLMGLEIINMYKIVGGALILMSTYITTISELKYRVQYQ